MSKPFVFNLGLFLRTTGALLAIGFLPGVLPAQQSRRAGARVQQNIYPGLEQDHVVYGSQRDQLD
jgi:hypothetical protein